MAEQNDEFRSREYPLRESMELQRRQWRAERLGWALFLVIVLLALAGVFSRGVLSHVTAHTADGQLSVTYQRFERHQALSQMKIEARSEGELILVLELTGDLLDAFTIESIQPAPVRSASFHGGLRLEFAADPQGGVTVHLATNPEGFGSSRSEVGLAGGQSVSFHQFIYP